MCHFSRLGPKLRSCAASLHYYDLFCLFNPRCSTALLVSWAAALSTCYKLLPCSASSFGWPQRSKSLKTVGLRGGVQAVPCGPVCAMLGQDLRRMRRDSCSALTCAAPSQLAGCCLVWIAALPPASAPLSGAGPPSSLALALQRCSSPRHACEGLQQPHSRPQWRLEEQGMAAPAGAAGAAAAACAAGGGRGCAMSLLAARTSRHSINEYLQIQPR